jgi:hypothetical protein
MLARLELLAPMAAEAAEKQGQGVPAPVLALELVPHLMF